MKAVVLLFALLAAPCWGEQLRGTVVSITDGDTITVLDQGRVQHKIRLSGIDAPEHRQAFGNASRQHLASLVFQKEVVVETTKKDRYGRLIGKVVVGDRDVCRAQIESGLAWHYKKYAGEQAANDRELYAAAEVAARKSGAGLWADTDPVPPWEWRKTKK